MNLGGFMGTKVKGYAAMQANDTLKEWVFERRDPNADDVQIEILYCGVCHSDYHQVTNDWGMGLYPMVPGHEIVGKVTAVGASVKKFKVGDSVGVGVLVDSCGECEDCKEHLEQYCPQMVMSYGSYYDEGGVKTITQGGYSKQIVTKEDFVLRISDKLDLKRAAPLLCAGITTYSPLNHWKVGKGTSVAVLGLGGLGHMGVKFAAAMGAEVSVLSSSISKEKDAKALGAHRFICTKDKDVFKQHAKKFDFILNTVSAPLDINDYIGLLKRDGTLCNVGLPSSPYTVQPGGLIFSRRSFAGSMIGGIKETQEMLDFCAKHNVVADVELIKISEINEAFKRMLASDVRYRFVIDMSSL